MSEITLAASLEDRYRVERELGAGGMATVYLAEDLKHKRKVALKVLRPELAATLGADRFLREIEIAARLRHPHILPLYDSGTAGDAFYYVMPLAEGESLRDRLDREKQLSVPEALKISREVADALAYAHSRGVVHRDIKPENILLESGHAVVADFGIARAIGSAADVTLTEAGMAIGTPTYMSPEQAAGEKDVDGRSDIYSLACVSYEMLAGEPPFTGPTIESIVRQHLTTDPRPVDSLRTAVQPRIAQAVSQALSKIPSDRFATAAEFGAVLTTTDERESMVRPATTPRRRGLGMLIAAAAVVLAAAGAWWLGGRGAAQPESMEVRRDWLVVAAFDGSAELSERQMAREFVRTALDQSSVVMTVPDNDIRQGLTLMDRPDSTRVDATLARELAVRSNIRAFVTGQIDRVGNTYAVLLRVMDADSGIVILAERAIAESVDDLIPTVDETVRTLREGLGEQRDVMRATRALREVMTPSFAAFQKWHESSMEMQTRGNQGRALELLREALEIDPEFASARLAMFPRFMNFNARDSARAAVEGALALSHRLTESERLKAEAALPFLDGDVPSSLNRYRELAERYQDAGAYTNWGLMEAQMGRQEEALEIYRNAPAPFGYATTNLWNQSEALLNLGRTSELDSLIDYMPEPWRDGRRFDLAIGAKRFDDVERIWQERRDANPPRNAGARIFAEALAASLNVLRGRVTQASGALEDMLDLADTVGSDEPNPGRRIRVLLQTELTQLNLALAAGMPVPPSHFTTADTSVVAMLVRGVALGLAGDDAEAEVLMQSLGAREQELSAELGPSPDLIQAAVAAGRADWDQVREVLAPARDWNWPYRTFRGPRIGSVAVLLLAEAYERTGQLDSAAALLEQLASPGVINRINGDPSRVPLLYPFATFRMARALTQLDRVEEARTAWLAFLDVFTDPDADYQWMVDEANEALARLAEEGTR